MWGIVRALFHQYLRPRRYKEYRNKRMVHDVEVLFTGQEPEMVRHEWCERNIEGKFSTTGGGLHPTLLAFRMIYHFTDPDDAFAFKMRFG